MKRRLAQLRYRWPLYLFILPALGLILLFAYYPAVSGVFHSFFFWNGQDISYFTGVENYRLLWHDALFQRGFGLVAILTVANIFKMFPSIVTDGRLDSTGGEASARPTGARGVRRADDCPVDGVHPDLETVLRPTSARLIKCCAAAG